MKRFFTALLLFMSSALAFAQMDQATTFILVRHAEKGSNGTDDPDLKPEGVERARRLASMLANTAVDAIYSTKYKRTRSTVIPLAESKSLTLRIYDALTPEVIDGWITQHAGKTVVIGGHSNTVPQIANLLIGKDEFQNFPDGEYGNILVVTVLKRGDGKVIRLLY